MTVSIIFSSTNGGAAITDTLDHGNASNGAETTAEEIFIRHNGTNSITSTKIYMRQFSGAYAGSATAAGDLSEMFAWGDESTESAFGGYMINFNAAQSYPTADWPTYNNKSPSGGTVFRTGVGDSESNAITIPTSTGATSSGEIQAGTSPNVRFKAHVAVPSDEDTIGIRQWETILVYQYTS